MKYVIDIADNNTESFLEILRRFSNVKAKPLSAPDAAILEEINYIKKPLKTLIN